MKRRYTESVSGCAFLLSFNPCQTMKRALQNLFRKGEGNLIKILCLGVGMAIGLVMLAEVIFERSYDNFIPIWKTLISYRKITSSKVVIG